MIELPEKIYKQAAHHLAFFADDGISMSEANTIAGKAGDIADTVNRLLAQTGSFIKTTTLDDQQVTLVAPKKIENLADVTHKDGDLYGLKAYLMEAIKAKNALIQTLRTVDKSVFLSDDEKFNKYDLLEDKLPERENTDENTILAGWTVEERAEYYLLEAQVAHLGKKVHPGGILDKLAQESFEGVRFEREELNSGQGATKTYIATVASVYTPDEAQTVFYQIHDLRRELEKRLNYLKARLQNESNNRAVEAENEYQQKLAVYTELQKRKQAEDTGLDSVLNARRLNLVRAAADLKIVLPNVLREIHDFVVNFDGRLV